MSIVISQSIPHTSLAVAIIRSVSSPENSALYIYAFLYFTSAPPLVINTSGCNSSIKDNAFCSPLEVCSVCKIQPEDIISFGDDYADIGMLELCGTGVAMGNAIDEVRERADLVIGSNDEDGIAEYLAGLD